MHRVQVETENHSETEEFHQSVLETPTVSGVLTAHLEFPVAICLWFIQQTYTEHTVCLELLRKEYKKMIGT